METNLFTPLSPFRWQLPRTALRGMKTDAEVFASEELLADAAADDSLGQVISVASLPGIVGPALAMPDIHQGYGFCIGGVAAFPASGGIVLPGGVGYDINCGVRLLATTLPADVFAPLAEEIGGAVLRSIPTGLANRGGQKLSRPELLRIVQRGAEEVIRCAAGDAKDLERTESHGRLDFDSPEVISERAWERGASQVGTLGSGNHFLEFGVIEEVTDLAAASAFGLRQGTISILIHTGSRGFGHQIASDHIELFRRKHLDRLHGLDPQLIHAPIDSSEGQRYLAALAAAANFAFANRQQIQQRVIEILERSFAAGREKLGLRLVYDQTHNIAKVETHRVQGREQQLLVHRKGATRAFPAASPDIPEEYRQIGQPVILPGSMGSSSWVMKGGAAAMEISFGSAAHGAGRRLSRHQALRHPMSQGIRERMSERGIRVFSFSSEGLREEIPEAYKKIDQVVASTEGAGLATRVARIRPLVVIKG